MDDSMNAGVPPDRGRNEASSRTQHMASVIGDQLPLDWGPSTATRQLTAQNARPQNDRD
jgi:hypothetical protein